jgi:hypothetical protein
VLHPKARRFGALLGESQLSVKPRGFVRMGRQLDDASFGALRSLLLRRELGLKRVYLYRYPLQFLKAMHPLLGVFAGPFEFAPNLG